MHSVTAHSRSQKSRDLKHNCPEQPVLGKRASWSRRADARKRRERKGLETPAKLKPEDRASYCKDSTNYEAN